MTTTVDRVGDAEEFDEPLLFGRLLELAQNVLSGRGEQGLLAGIEEPDRTRFASALWLEGADSDAPEFWLHNLCNILCDHGIDPCQIELDDDSMCPCGHRLSRHADRCGMGLEGKSRASHLYLDSRHLESRVRTFRAEALAQHPVLLDLVLQAAYGARGPASRRAHAWQVLDDIDHRRPLIEALARFFRVWPSAIRAFRHWRPESPQHWLAYPSARRVASMLAVLPAEDGTDLDTREFWRWIVVAHVVTRCARVTPEYLMQTEFLDGVDRLLTVKPANRHDLRRRLRQAIRWLRQERRRDGGTPRPSRLLAAIGVRVPQPVVLDFCFTLPGGWVAAALEAPDAIREEGRTMEHCLGRYVKEIGRGEANAYTLRSQAGAERATLLTRRWPLNYEGDEALHVTLKGIDNDPVQIGALEATLALIRMVAPNVTHVDF